jgi:uncharacterized protein
MKRVLLIAMCILAFSSTSAFADEAGLKKMALNLLEITNARSGIDRVMKSAEGTIRQQLDTLSIDLPPEGREEVAAVRKDCIKWLSDNLSWDQMKDIYVDIYAHIFNEDEMGELIRFYQSPLGQKMLKKMPEIIQLSVQRSQALIQKKMPELQKKLKKSLADIETKYKKGATQQEGVANPR